MDFNWNKTRKSGMTQLTIKIVDTEGDSVLVKFASENSAKTIDEYDAVAFQPKTMGYATKEEFVEGVKPVLLSMVETRDASEQSNIDLSSWSDYEDSSEVTSSNEVDVIPDSPDETQSLPEPEVTL